MDINVEIKEEMELDESSVMIQSEDISNLKITPVRDLKEENQSNLPLTCEKKEPDDVDNMYESHINNMELKEKFNYSQADDETLSKIKTEELLLKSEHESEGDENETRAYREEDRQNHTLTNTDDKRYICCHCGNKYYQKSCLKRHIKLKHVGELSINKYGCDYCVYRTNNRRHLDSHVLAEHKAAIEKFYCDHCDYRTHREYTMNRHIIAKHKSFINKYICYHCDFIAHQKVNLETHIMIQHLKMPNKRHTCDHCDYKTSNKSAFYRHLSAIHDNIANKKYACDHCDYKTYYKNHLNRHVLVKHATIAIEKYCCDNCDYKTNNKSHLNSHLVAKHDKIPINCCDYCDYTTHLKGNLKRHIKVRHVKKLFINKYGCDHCDYKSNNKRHLNSHVLAEHKAAISVITGPTVNTQ